MPSVLPGLDVALERLPWGRARIGLVTHDPAVAADGRTSRQSLLQAGSRIVRLFAPEHGIQAAAREGAQIADGTDPLTGLPVVSLYRERRAPRDEDLEGLDALVVDLQDVGARCYTYPSTLMLCLEAAARAGLPVWVLDRPNPVSGLHAEGLVRRSGFESFVGHLPIPMRHALTFGELATWARPRPLELHVVEMRGWRRDMWWEGTGRSWVPPSPNIPDPDTALAYLATVYLEGTSWSEGRGTAHPFVTVAGPEHPITVGWEDRERFHPVAEGIRILARLVELDGPRWTNDGRTLDLLFGSDWLRLTLEAGGPVDELIEQAEREGRTFTASVAQHHLYE